MSDQNNFTPNMESYQPLSPFKLFVKSNFPFIEATFEALDNYGLYCKIVEYLNTVISNENKVEDNVLALYNAFISLNNYVSNYFDNLDVQEEINNKLDDMAEAGTLEEIISYYLNSNALFGFNNVAEMKQATNLINGSYAKTLGYYEINDGGGAVYKIRTKTNDDVVDNGSIIQMTDSTLVAVLIINDYITPEMFGAKRDGESDDFIPFTNCISYALIKKVKIKLNAGTYYISEALDLQYPKDLIIEGTEGRWAGSSIIETNDIALKWCGANNCIIRGVYFVSSIGIQFYERDVHSQDSRTYNCIIENCTFRCITSGIDIETLNGYMYIKHNTFRIRNTGIRIGYNFTNLTGITAPNYFYITENNFLEHNDIIQSDSSMAIDVYYCAYVFIDKNDFVTKIGLNFTNLINTTSNFRITNNSFFRNVYAIKADSTNSQYLKDLLISNNTIALIATSYGIDVSSDRCQHTSIVSNVFPTPDTTVTPLGIVKYHSASTTGNVFVGNTPQNITTGVSNLCTFPGALILSAQNYYVKYISLPAGGTGTHTLGSKYSWFKQRYVRCTNPNITVTQTQNDDGSIVASVANNTESTQNGILISSY